MGIVNLQEDPGTSSAFLLQAFANTASEMFKLFGAQKEGGVTLIAQLPGREERSDEENTTDWLAPAPTTQPVATSPCLERSDRDEN